MRPTDDTYTELQTAFDHFNAELFDGKLPPCLLTLQREKKTYGYFSAERFVRRGDGAVTDEIALNPAYFGIVPVVEIMQTIVHEMAHLWQHHFGSPGRRRYHNRQWAEKMETIGLMPSDTGEPGGQKTGECMADYPIEGGNFLAACEKLLTKDFRISWLDRFPARHVTTHLLPSAQAGTDESAETEESGISNVVGGVVLNEETSKPTRMKYTCPDCATNVWGKPNLKLICGACGSAYEINDT